METLRVLFLVMQTLMVTTALNKLPFFGPRMCEHLCQRTVGCSSFQYSTKFLSCKLQSDPTTRLEDSFQNFTISKEMKTDTGVELSCPNSSKMFFNRQKVLKCRADRPIQIDRAGGRHSSKLLVYQRFSNKGVTEISLSDYSVKTIHYKDMSNIHFLTYVSSLRSFLIIYRGRLYLYDISKQKESEKIDVAVSCACVEKDNIFYIIHPNRLMRTKLNGTDKVSIKKLNFIPLYINVDGTKSIIYVFSNIKLQKVSYEGKVLKAYDYNFGTMCFGQNGDIFYTSSTKMCSIYSSLSSLIHDRRNKKFAKCNVSLVISSMFYYENQIYAVTTDCRVVRLGPSGSEEIKTDGKKKKKCMGSLIIEN